jgi:hypothetical protein
MPESRRAYRIVSASFITDVQAEGIYIYIVKSVLEVLEKDKVNACVE